MTETMAATTTGIATGGDTTTELGAGGQPIRHAMGYRMRHRSLWVKRKKRCGAKNRKGEP